MLVWAKNRWQYSRLDFKFEIEFDFNFSLNLNEKHLSHCSFLLYLLEPARATQSWLSFDWFGSLPKPFSWLISGMLMTNLGIVHRWRDVILNNKNNLSCVATSVLRMRLLHAVAFSKKLRWLAQKMVITLKTLMHAVNARRKRVSQRSFKD